MQSLKYTHKRYCKAKRQELERLVPVLQPAPIPNLERKVTANVLGEAQTERGTARFVPMRVEPSLVPTDEHVTAFLLNQKKLKANKKRKQMSNLFKKALPQ